MTLYSTENPPINIEKGIKHRESVCEREAAPEIRGRGHKVHREGVVLIEDQGAQFLRPRLQEHASGFQEHGRVLLEVPDHVGVQAEALGGRGSGGGAGCGGHAGREHV